MALDVRHGSEVILEAQGDDAAEAIAALIELLRQGLGDENCKPVAQVVAEPIPVVPSKPSQPVDPDRIDGVAASPGVRVGTIFQVRHEAMHIEETADHPAEERRLLETAIEKAKAQLATLQEQLQAGRNPAQAAIFAAHAELLDDPEMIETAAASIDAGKSAPFAWQSAFQLHAERLAAMQNPLLAQRANDLRDIGGRVLEILTGVSREKPVYPAQSILIAEDLTPSDTASLDRKQIRGFCTVHGGSTSHVAILARSLGIPAIAGIDPRALELANGTQVILDGDAGFLRLNPSAALMEQIQQQQQADEAKRQEDTAHAHEPAVTADSRRIEVVANIGGVRDAEQVDGLGGEGVGLLRSEFLFMQRASAPSEDEQFESYKAVAQAIGAEKPLIIRTLDVGGDKPLAYLPIPKEDNPFLGERGIRVGLDRPEILHAQLRAILRASEFGNIRVMFPMISTLEELRAAKEILSEEAARLGVATVPVGIMVELPAAAVMASQFAKEADFFSVGTNDLTQYTLAIDRGHPKLAPQADGLHPAVLKMIELSVIGAHAHGKTVGVCGGIASDARAVPILVGLGVDELSVSLPAIPAVKAQIRTLNFSACQQLAQKAVECATATEVRALVSAPA